MKLKRTLATLIMALTIMSWVPNSVRAIASSQDLVIEKAKTLLTEALSQETFYSFNMAYAEIVKINDVTIQGQMLGKLAAIQEKVWTSDVANYVDLLQQLTNTGSGKIYDQTEALIRNSSSIKFVDKEYLLGEITGWGRKLVYTSDYTTAVDSINIAWNNISSKNIEIAESNISKVKNSYSRAYLQEEVDKIKRKLSQNTDGLTYNEDGFPIVKSLESYKNLLHKALGNFDDKLSIEIQGYDDKIYSLSVINEILTEDPTLNYGYVGANCDISWIGDGSIRTVKITFNYEKSRDEMLMMKTKVEEKAVEILANIVKPTMKDYEKERAIHDYVVNNSRYDIENFNNNTIPVESFTDYGVLINGVGVCDGYARAMFRLLNAAGVKCLYVVGTANGGGHAWNIVQLGGDYYHLDATWDDPVSTSGQNILSYKYYNVTDTVIGRDHYWDRSKYPLCTATTYSYSNIK